MWSVPALLTTTSTRPYLVIVASISATPASGRPRSPGTAWPSRRSAARLSSRSARRAARPTDAPAASSTRANRAPSPELAPVTIATRPSRRNGVSGSTGRVDATFGGLRGGDHVEDLQAVEGPRSVGRRRRSLVRAREGRRPALVELGRHPLGPGEAGEPVPTPETLPLPGHRDDVVLEH